MVASGELYIHFPELQLETVALKNLGDIWRNLTLGGYYWRLYHHDSEGAGVYLNGKKMELHPDKLYLLPPYCNLRTWVSGNPCQLYLHFILTSIPGNGVPPLLAFPLDGTLKELRDELVSSLRNPDDKRIRRSLLASALASLAVADLPKELFSGVDSDRRIMDIRILMRERLNQQFDVASLANESGMSENNFLTLFKEQTGSTPYQYLLHLRYSRAATLLESGKFTIDEICDAIGVKDRFHFSRTFKKIYGSAPASYRKNFMRLNKNIYA